jgi:hypothetical protein
MTIIDTIEQQWVAYVTETGRMPKYLFLGDREAAALDKFKGMVVLSYRDMFTIMVQKDSWLSVGDKYTSG